MNSAGPTNSYIISLGGTVVQFLSNKPLTNGCSEIDSFGLEFIIISLYLLLINLALIAPVANPITTTIAVWMKKASFLAAVLLQINP